MMPISNFILKLLLYEKTCLDCDTLAHGILFDFSRWKFLFWYSYNHSYSVEDKFETTNTFQIYLRSL